MPGWHTQTKSLVSEGKLKVAGIVQEQHPDRAVLFMQWQKMDWPVLSDPFNELAITAVPITLLIDASGVIRFKNPKPADLETFLATDYPLSAPTEILPAGDFEIATLEKKVSSDARDAVARFQLGVAYRMRYDSGRGPSDDFAKAISSWKEALALNPNQYIWRRRIQQYGPRLDKPYSFYDWVNQAREELKARGQTPHPLVAEPGGSEFASPGGEIEASAPPTHPDPDGKVTRDASKRVAVKAVVVPTTKGDGKAVRVHLRFQPNVLLDVHWTNDAGNLEFFVEGTDKVSIVDRQGPGENPEQPTSVETRLVEFEVRPLSDKELPKVLKGAAFYYVCEGTTGVCHYLRQDVSISLRP